MTAYAKWRCLDRNLAYLIIFLRDENVTVLNSDGSLRVAGEERKLAVIGVAGGVGYPLEGMRHQYHLQMRKMERSNKVNE